MIALRRNKSLQVMKIRQKMNSGCKTRTSTGLIGRSSEYRGTNSRDCKFECAVIRYIVLTSILEQSTNMPPRLPALTASVNTRNNISPLVACLLPFFQARNASILGSLSDAPGAYSKKIRRGRGPSSGHGKTSGRGHKGQKQHGKVPARFQGGQTPLDKVHGKRGFENLYDFSGELP